MTIIITAVADSFGRRFLLIIGAVLMAVAGWAFAISDNPILLTIAAIFVTSALQEKKSDLFFPSSKQFCHRRQATTS